jgi:hypothetical protein
VKRTSANDSMLFACESRSPPSLLFRSPKGDQQSTPAMKIVGVFAFMAN